MGGEEILEYLTNNVGQKFTTKQLSEVCNCTASSISHSVKSLKKFKMIKTEKMKRHKCGNFGRLHWV